MAEEKKERERGWIGLSRTRFTVASFVALALAVVMVLSVGMAAATLTGGLHASHSSPSATTHAPTPMGPSLLAELKAQLGPAQSVSIGSKLSGHAVPATSSNWAGYVAVPKADGEIQEVTAEWYVPTVTCGNAPSGGSFQVSWVGIDGWTSGTVEQVGTLSYCSTTGATPAYYSWWEFYPYNDITTVNVIGGGAFVAAYVLYNPAECFDSVCGVYTLVFHDLDDGISWAVTGDPATCDSAGCEGGVNADAECISEAPSGFGYPGITPLADYGTTTFYACAAEINGEFKGIASFGSSVATVYKVNQVDGSDKTVQSTAGAVSYFYGKSEFTITWKRYT